MTAATWQPGKFYANGDLCTPSSQTVATPVQIPNGTFESGDTAWDKGTGWTIQTSGEQFQGSWSAKFNYTGTSNLDMSTPVAVVVGQSITLNGMIDQGDSDAGDAGARVALVWLDSSGDELLVSLGNNVTSSVNDAWHQSTITAAAPPGAVDVIARVIAFRTTGSHPVYADNISWSYAEVSPKAGLIYKAVQPDIGKSGSTEPVWPTTLGVQVVDNEVIWETIGDTRIVWEAAPILESGGTEPNWPTTPGAMVADGSISWECIVRNVTDEKCPNTKVVLIAASKIFAVDDDIIAFSATVNPLDWSTKQDAGYLPTGLQQYGANSMAALGLYRGNLVAWNSQGMQIWQVDEDPARMALLDALPIGSTYPKAVAPMGNDLFFLTKLGARSVGIAAGSTNLQAGDFGMPIDSLVQAALEASPSEAKATYFPSQGQYWLWFNSMRLTGAAPDGTFGAAYSYTYTVQGGIGPFVFSITAGTLPETITLNTATGEISGTITSAPGEEFDFTIMVTDSTSATASLDDHVEISVVPVPAIYVVNNDLPGTLTILSPTTNLEVGTIALGEYPYRIVKNADSTRLYVSSFDTNQVMVINTLLQTVIATIDVVTAPAGLAIRDSSSELFVANTAGPDNVAVIDTVTNTLSGTLITTPNNSEWMAISADLLSLYVACNALGILLKVIDIETGTIAYSVSGSGEASQIIVHPDGAKIYLCRTSGLSVIETAGYTVTQTISTGRCYSAVLIGTDLYVGFHDAAGSVKVVDTVTDTVTDTIGAGTIAYAYGMAASADGATAYVCEYDYPARVHVIDTASKTITTVTTLSTNSGFDMAVVP